MGLFGKSEQRPVVPHAANVNAAAITMGHGLLYCTANNLIAAADSGKYWAALLEGAYRQLVSPTEKDLLRSLVRQEIRDTSTLAAYDNHGKTPYLGAMDVSLEPVLEDGNAMLQNINEIVWDQYKRGPANAKDRVLKDAFPMFRHYTGVAAETAHCRTSEPDEMAGMLSFSLALWTSDLISSPSHKSGYSPGDRIETGKHQFSLTYMSWAMWLPWVYHPDLQGKVNPDGSKIT